MPLLASLSSWFDSGVCARYKKCSCPCFTSPCRILSCLVVSCHISGLVCPLVPLATTTTGASRERDRRRDRHRDSEWALLSNIGAIAETRRRDNADGSLGGKFGGGGVNDVLGPAVGDGDGQSGLLTAAADDAKAQEILDGVRLLISVRVTCRALFKAQHDQQPE